MFWNREELPPELKDKKPGEIAAALKKLEELEAQSRDFETTKSDLENRLTAQQTEYDQVKSRLQEMEAGIQNYQQQMQAQQQIQQPPINMWNEPDKYIDQRTQGTQALAVHGGRMGAYMYFKDNLSPRDQQIFKKYQKEVEQTVNTYAPAFQTMPQNWFVAFNYIKGLHEQDIGKAEAEGTPFFAEPASRGAQQEPPAEDKLSEEEEDIVKRMHWNREGYLKQKKQMALHQAEKGSFARYPVPMKHMGGRV